MATRPKDSNNAHTHTPLDVSIQRRAHGPVFSHQSMICIAVLCVPRMTNSQRSSMIIDLSFLHLSVLFKKIYSSRTYANDVDYCGPFRSRGGKTEENFERNGEKQTRFDLTLEWGCWTVAGNPALVFWRRDAYAHASPAFSFWYNKGIRNIEGVCVYSLNVSNKLSVRDFAAYTELRSRAKHKLFDADNFSIHIHTPPAHQNAENKLRTIQSLF